MFIRADLFCPLPGANTMLLMQKKSVDWCFLGSISSIWIGLNHFSALRFLRVCVYVRVCITHVKSVQAVTCYGSRTSPPPRHHISASVLLHQGRGAGATCPKLWKKAENGNRSIHLSKSRSVTQSVSEAGSGEWALSLWARLGKSKDQLHRWCLLLRGEGWRGMVGWKLLLSAWVWADCMFALQPTQTK